MLCMSDKILFYSCIMNMLTTPWNVCSERFVMRGVRSYVWRLTTLPVLPSIGQLHSEMVVSTYKQTSWIFNFFTSAHVFISKNEFLPIWKLHILLFTYSSLIIVVLSRTSVATRQHNTTERPRLTKSLTAHISRGAYVTYTFASLLEWCCYQISLLYYQAM